MSSFDLADRDEANILDQARTNPAYLEEASAPWYQGSLTAPLTGLGELAGDIQGVTGLALSTLARGVDGVVGTKLEDATFDYIAEPGFEFAKRMQPNAHDVGFAGQVLHGLAKIGGEVALFRTPGTFAMETMTETVSQAEKGVDSNTASALGLTHGAVTAAAVALPLTLARASVIKNMLFGGGVGVVQGVIERGSMSGILSSAGYKDMAKQYEALDAQAMLADAVLNAAFAGGAKYLQGRGRVKPSDVDAALVVNDAVHAERSGPGVPIDLASRDSNIKNLDGAIEDLMEGRPVTIREPVGDFLPNSVRDENSELISDALKSEFVRVYRGEGVAQTPIPEWVRVGMQENGSLDAQGRWWTPDLEIAKWYADDAGETGRILYQDIPTKVAEDYLVDKLSNDIKRFSLDPTNELFLPKEYAGKGKELIDSIIDTQVVEPKSEAQPKAEAAAKEDPIVMRAREQALKFPQAEVVLEDGRRATLEEATGIMDEMQSAADDMSIGIEAAIHCFLGGR
jgi:hypothetical protein